MSYGDIVDIDRPSGERQLRVAIDDVANHDWRAFSVRFRVDLTPNETRIQYHDVASRLLLCKLSNSFFALRFGITVSVTILDTRVRIEILLRKL